ncbi:MAG TPA: L,D-transpeptidase family protein [Miltoncostaea sp.]|nr:L,D-transpeptidase family protein [Miltoncostaea sp.]
MRALRGAVTMGLVACAAAAVPALAAAQAPVTPPTPLPAGQIAPGVSIAGVQVGGQWAADARQNVIDNHVAPRRTPLLVTFRGRNLKVEPVKAGYVADVDYAVKVALIYGRQRPVPAEGVDVPLKEKVNRKKLAAILTLRAKANDVPAVDASVSLKGVTPVFRKPRIGTAIDVPKATDQIAQAIVVRDRTSYALPSKRLIPARTSVGAIVVIDRGAFRLTWYKGKRKLSFPVAVGQPAYPTPTGNFSVIQKQVNPTWFPPSSPWAAGLGPIPPGVNNPLGTRWIGTSAPGIGMHGTPISSSIGTRASHGCIRMYISDVEKLYPLVDIGTPVYIR